MAKLNDTEINGSLNVSGGGLFTENVSAPNINSLSNPNLLINGDFQVWQRGTSFENDGSSGQYTADRWSTYFKNRTTKGEYIGIKITATGADYGSVYQYIEIPQCVANVIVGRDITLSVCMRTNRTRKCLIGFASNLTHVETSNEFVTYTSTKKLTSNDLVGISGDVYSLRTFAFSCTNELDPNIEGDVIEIAWCKVELGSIATPFVPRPYAEEFAMCQRYYEMKMIQGDMIDGDTLRNGYILLSFNLAPKRVNPTITFCDRTDNFGYISRISTSGSNHNQPCRIYTYPSSYKYGCYEMISDNGSNALTLSGFVYADAEIY